MWCGPACRQLSADPAGSLLLFLFVPSWTLVCDRDVWGWLVVGVCFGFGQSPSPCCLLVHTCRQMRSRGLVLCGASSIPLTAAEGRGVESCRLLHPCGSAHFTPHTCLTPHRNKACEGVLQAPDPCQTACTRLAHCQHVCLTTPPPYTGPGHITSHAPCTKPRLEFVLCLCESSMTAPGSQLTVDPAAVCCCAASGALLHPAVRSLFGCCVEGRHS